MGLRGIDTWYRAGSFVIAGMTPYPGCTFANEGHRKSLGSVNNPLEQLVIILI